MDNLGYIGLSDAAKHFPGNPSASAVWRWCRKGTKARTRVRIRLEHVRVGGRIFTKPEWCTAFMAALAAADVEHFKEAEVKITHDVVAVDTPRRLTRGRMAGIKNVMIHLELRKTKGLDSPKLSRKERRDKVNEAIKRVEDDIDKNHPEIKLKRQTQ